MVHIRLFNVPGNAEVKGKVRTYLPVILHIAVNLFRNCVDKTIIGLGVSVRDTEGEVDQRIAGAIRASAFRAAFKSIVAVVVEVERVVDPELFKRAAELDRVVALDPAEVIRVGEVGVESGLRALKAEAQVEVVSYRNIRDTRLRILRTDAGKACCTRRNDLGRTYRSEWVAIVGGAELVELCGAEGMSVRTAVDNLKWIRPEACEPKPGKLPPPKVSVEVPGLD